MKKLLLLTLLFASCQKEDYCIKCEKGNSVYRFCEGDVDATVITYNLTNQGYLCERD